MVSSSEPQPAGTAPAAMTAALRAERIRTLYRQHPALIIVNPINAAIVAALLWTSTPPLMLTGWVAAMLLVTTVRVLLRRRYLEVQPGPEATDVWARRIVVGTAATGLLWGAAGALFYDAGAMAPQMLLVFVIGGMVAGASGTLALHLPAFFAFTISAVLPTALRMFSEGDWFHAGMGGLAIVYGAAMSLLAVNTNRGVTEALRLRFEKDDLLASLTRAQALLALANETLEQRVAERGASSSGRPSPSGRAAHGVGGPARRRIGARLQQPADRGARKRGDTDGRAREMPLNAAASRRSGTRSIAARRW